MVRDPDILQSGCNAYGFSKALVSAYTWCLAKEHADLIINAVSPGYINTDMTSGGGATNPPSMGAIPPTWLLMDESLQDVPTGRYYGNDCKRSPLDVYRGPLAIQCTKDPMGNRKVVLQSNGTDDGSLC